MLRDRSFRLGSAVLAAGMLLCGCAGGGTPASNSGSPRVPAQAAASSPAGAPASAPGTGGGRTGCSLVSQAEASAAAGASLGAGHQAPYTAQQNIVAHSGCLYTAGSEALGFDLNTMAASLPLSAALTAGLAKAKAMGATKITVGGSTGFSLSRGTLQLVTFYRGRTAVSVTAVNARPGAALAVAKLIAARM